LVSCDEKIAGYRVDLIWQGSNTPVLPHEGLLGERTGSKTERVGLAETKQRIGLAFIRQSWTMRRFMESELNKQPPPPTPNQGGFKSIVFNILIPVLLLTQGDRLTDNAAIVLVAALAFPAGWFVVDYRRTKRANFISILGFVSVLLTGGVGLLQLPRFWFIIKETAIPLLIGLAVFGSLWTRYPLIRALVFSREIFDVDLITSRLQERGTTARMDATLRHATAFLSLSFFISALLNFILASHFVQTEPSIDPAAFNAEVGAMTGWSYVVIAVPSMLFMFGILWWVVRGIRLHAGLSFDEATAPHLRDQQKPG
jgi:hypothetical protein